MRQFIQRGIFRRREIGPVQPARHQVFAVVSDQGEKRIIRLGNAVKLSGNHAGDGRLRRNRAGCARGCAATSHPARDDRVKSRTTLAKPRNSPFSSLSAIVMALAQNREPSFLACQPSFAKWPSARRPVELLLQSHAAESRRLDRETRRAGRWPRRLDSRKCARLRNTRRQRVRQYPVGRGRSPVSRTVCGAVEMLCDSAGPVFPATPGRGARARRLPLAVYSTSRGIASGPSRRSVPSLLPLLLQSVPKLRYLGFETGLREFVDSAADNLVSRHPQELARSHAGVPGIAFVVRNQDGRRRVIDNRPKKQLKFFRTVFDQPTGVGHL